MTALGADQIFLQNQNGQNKEEQEKLPFELGQEVKVKRSSGEVEKDWLVAGYDIAGKGWVRVEKGSLSKDIPQEKLVSWQEFFIPGEQVKVKRSSGEVENDWVVKAYDEEAQQVVVRLSSSDRPTSSSPTSGCPASPAWTSSPRRASRLPRCR